MSIAEEYNSLLDFPPCTERLPGAILESESGYQRCTQCIMDTTDPGITFDKDGVCKYCHQYQHRFQEEVRQGAEAEAELHACAESIKRCGHGKEYDCVIGVSGGMDSTYVAYTAKRLGLRPLAVHLDNGWNSELAVANIQRTVQTLDIDLYTHVVDWEEFRDLHVSFLKASLPNSEVPTDHAILATVYKEAARRNIHYFLSGGNVATESIMPASWLYDNRDLRHLKSVHRRFGTRPLKTLPTFTLSKFAFWTFVKGIRSVRILNLLPYVKRDVAALLEKELGWRNYGGKHYESVYTKWFQAFLLPTKFKIDKRLAHYSSLVCAQQMTRDEALIAIQEPLYDLEELQGDTEFLLKKLGLSHQDFRNIMASPIRDFRDFKSNARILSGMPWIMSVAKRKAVFRPARRAA